jgi:hypothetical protein
VRLTTPTHSSATISTASDIASSVRGRGLGAHHPGKCDPGHE